MPLSTRRTTLNTERAPSSSSETGRLGDVDVAVAEGGTGASTASTARENLGAASERSALRLPGLVESTTPSTLANAVAWDILWSVDQSVPSAKTGNNVLATIPDHTGNGYDAVQATSNVRPGLRRSGLNGRDVMVTSASGQWRAATATFTQVDQPFTLYVVGDLRSNGGRLVGLTGSDGTNRVGIGSSGGGLVFTQMGTNILGPARSNGFKRYAAVLNGAASFLRVEGSDTPGDAGSASIVRATLGAEVSGAGTFTSFTDTYIAFAGIYFGALTRAELDALDAIAAAEFGLDNDDVISADGWSWWTRPRAVAYNGKTWVGTASSGSGNVVLQEMDPERDGFITRHVLATFESDDHNNPALVVVPNKPMLAFYNRHNADNFMRWRKSSVNIEDGVDFNAEQTSNAGGTTTYAIPIVHNDDIYVWTRIGTSAWGFAKSDDWGDTLGSWTSVFSGETYQFYCAFARYGKDIVRVAASTHPTAGSPPDQNIYYTEINLTTGVVANRDGTVLGNIHTGVGLPIDLSDMETVATPTTNYLTWVYDVSDAPIPEVLWVEWDNSDIVNTANYYYSEASSGSWTQRDAGLAGNYFSDATQRYFGGCQFGRDGVQGRFWRAAESSGTWTISRVTTNNFGSTFTSTTLARASASKLCRVWPVDRLDNTPSWEAFCNDIVTFTLYTNWDGVLKGLQGPAL